MSKPSPHLAGTRSVTRRNEGFSLIEVTIAVGIVAFAMVASIGVLPVAMDIFQEARRDTIHANILRRISGEANLVPFDRLAEIKGVRYFDDQGVEISNSRDSIYTVTVEVGNPRPLPGQTKGSDAAKQIDIEFADIDRPDEPRRYAVIVADFGK